jgi:hypothetical protein
LHQHAARGVALAAKTVQEPKLMLLEARNLTRRFGGLVAVDDISLTVEKGEIVGLLVLVIVLLALATVIRLLGNVPVFLCVVCFFMHANSIGVIFLCWSADSNSEENTSTL